MKTFTRLVQELNEIYVFDRHGNVSDIDTSDIHGRCTNLSLKAFGICTTKVIESNLEICQMLRDAGYNIIDLKLQADRQKDIQDYIRTGSGLTDSPLSGKTLYYGNKWEGKFWNWKKLSPYLVKAEKCKTVKNVLQYFDVGRFIIGTAGHSMAYVDGKLYDFAARGPNTSRIQILEMVLTDSEFKGFLQDKSEYPGNK